MSEIENNLKEISFESFEALKELYKKHWPENILAYNFVDSMLKKVKKDQGYRELTNIFSIDGKVSEDGTFVGDILNKNLLIATKDLSFEKLKKLLKLIDFSIPRYICCVKEIYRDCVVDFLSSESSIKILSITDTVMMHMSKGNALKFEFEVPDGFELRSLTIKDADFVKSNWIYASILNENFVEYSIEYNLSVGLYSDKNELVAWCLLYDFKELLHLHTLPSHRRKGYAEIIIKAMSKKLAEEGSDVISCIVTENIASINLFNKLGFKAIDRNFWILTDKSE